MYQSASDGTNSIISGKFSITVQVNLAGRVVEKFVEERGGVNSGGLRSVLNTARSHILVYVYFTVATFREKGDGYTSCLSRKLMFHLCINFVFLTNKFCCANESVYIVLCWRKG